MNTEIKTPRIETVKPGSKIVFLTGPSDFISMPSAEGIAYGLLKSKWGNQLRVKCTNEKGEVEFRYIAKFTNVGIGAYYLG